MRVEDILTTTMTTVTPETSVREIAQLLLRHHVSALPVVNAAGALVGVVREADLMHRLETGTERHRSRWLAFLADPERLAHDYVKSHGRCAADVMAREVATVTPDTPIDELADLFEKRNVRRVPVVQDGRLVGMVSRADLLRGLAKPAKQPEAVPAPDDETIRHQVVEAIRSVDWGRAISVNIHDVFVANGVVELWGWVESDEEGRVARIAASNVPGVRAVEDHLARLPVWVWAE